MWVSSCVVSSAAVRRDRFQSGEAGSEEAERACAACVLAPALDRAPPSSASECSRGISARMAETAGLAGAAAPCAGFLTELPAPRALAVEGRTDTRPRELAGRVAELRPAATKSVRAWERAAQEARERTRRSRWRALCGTRAHGQSRAGASSQGNATPRAYLSPARAPTRWPSRAAAADGDRKPNHTRLLERRAPHRA